jgi:hypothetical protein
VRDPFGRLIAKQSGGVTIKPDPVREAWELSVR